MFSAPDPRDRTATTEAQEHLLRAVLRERAPSTVDVRAGWAAIETRLRLAPPHSPQPAPHPPARPRRLLPSRPRAPRRMVAVALLAATLIVSAGFAAGFAYSRACFVGGSAFLCGDLPQFTDGNFFQAVNQRADVNGVTITITSVYADRGVTLIAYRAQLSPALASRYDNVLADTDMSVTSASGERAAFPPADGRGTLCDAPDRNQGISVCYVRFEPLHPGASATQIAVTVEIPRVGLSRGPDSTTLAGPWHFQFTMTYHQQDRQIITLPPAAGPNQSIEATPSR